MNYKKFLIEKVFTLEDIDEYIEISDEVYQAIEWPVLKYLNKVLLFFEKVGVVHNDKKYSIYSRLTFNCIEADGGIIDLLNGNFCITGMTPASKKDGDIEGYELIAEYEKGNLKELTLNDHEDIELTLVHKGKLVKKCNTRLERDYTITKVISSNTIYSYVLYPFSLNSI